MAVIIAGEYITVQGNYIHDCYQKAIEIRAARYLKAYDNVIHSIAKTLLSGGHDIMRQQTGVEITTNDLDIYRWDIMGNLIFNVEQRIYSWVPSKEEIDMVLDEGKPILIDDPKDNDGIQETMKARIKDNVVAFGSIDQIRLKSTPNLTVSNNTVYSASPIADGITDKNGDTNTPQFTNTTITNNAVQTMPCKQAFEIGDFMLQGNTMGNVPPTINGNYAAVGSVTPTGQFGVTTISNSIFVDPDNGNFRLKPALGLPSTLGVPTATLDAIDARVAKFGVNVKWDRWATDHLKLTQTILDNAPGVNDGIANNEIVVANAGVMNATVSIIDFPVVQGTTWQTSTCQCPSVTHEEFHLNEAYTAWYRARKVATKNSSGGDYTRIRWGNSFLKQNQLFQNDWLTNSQIYSADSNTVIYGEDNHFTLNGDLLIDFEGYTPVVGNKWYLIRAKTISTANPGGRNINGQVLFDRVLFEGAALTDADYTLTIVDVAGGQALQLEILTPLPIKLISFNAIKENNKVKINWQTANEVNNDFFTIEKSKDGVNWNELATVPATRTPMSNNTYISWDNQPIVGKNYYRLKQTDFYGTFTYSNIVVVNFNSKGVQVYPNPAADFVSVSGVKSKGVLKILAIDGKIISTQKIQSSIEQVSVNHI